MAAASFAAAGAFAASREVLYGPAPSWVAAPPTETTASAPAGAPLRIAYSDHETFLSPDWDENYFSYRLTVTSPAGLAAGNITATWNPSSDELTVHTLKVIRDGHATDVLATNKFDIIQRENNLEYSILDGVLTASLQTPGLQVGDEIEFAATIRHHDPILGSQSYGLFQLPVAGTLGAHRVRLVWPDSRKVAWRATPDLGGPSLQHRDGGVELVYEIRDPTSSIKSDGAPDRYNVRRLVEYSGFSDWAQLSSLLWPLFDQASQLAPDSPIKAEAAKIAAASATPAARAEQALRLVQDRIRYVYVGLDGGNYRPATADETWKRRFGDCKAKTVLLIALLRELDLKSEAVLVNSHGGDAIGDRLPDPALFDHVLVRLPLGDRAYWLDGTRLGDHSLASLPAPISRWALPLNPRDARLEALPPETPRAPLEVVVMDIDASAGVDRAATVHAQEVLRGDGAIQSRAQLASVSPDDAQRAEKGFWKQQISWNEPSTVSWRFDEDRGVLILEMTGEGSPPWQGTGVGGHALEIPGAGFSPPAELRRPKEQDQLAPWLTEFPRYSCWATTIRLPPSTSKWSWDFIALPVNRKLGGVAYWREAALREGVMRTVLSKRTLTPEISAGVAEQLNTALADFDARISQVFQVGPQDRMKPSLQRVRPEPADWAVPDAPCSAPEIGH
jgi:hypothetical protein